MSYPIAAVQAAVGSRTARAGGPNLNAYADKLVGLFGSSIISYLPLWESSGVYADDYYSTNRAGKYGGTVTLGQPGIGDGRTCPLFAGGYVNWYSAGLASAFNGQEGSLLIWAKVANAGVWTDGLNHEFLRLMVNSSNYIGIGKKSTNGRLEYVYMAGGTQKQYRKEGNSETGMMKIGITWSLSNNRARVFYGGAKLGADMTGLGTFTGALSATATVIGAESTVTPTYPWSGWLAHAILLNREASEEEVAESAILPFDLSGLPSVPYGSSLRTYFLPSGGDINATLSTLRAGDTLELEQDGVYSFGPMEEGGASGFSTIPSGVPGYPTIVKGNGATVSGGMYAINTGPRGYLRFENLNVGPAKYWSLFAENAQNFDFIDCDFYNPANGVAYDVCRLNKCSYFTFTRCAAHSTIDVDGTRAHDGFELWGPCSHFTFTDCVAYDIKNGPTENEGHGFEVYGQLAGEIVDDVQFINCEAYNCNVGFSVEGGPLSLAHTNIVCDGCSSHDNAFYGYQGINGATLTRENLTGEDNSGNGVSETFGSVVDA